jgi:hypothetical protein
MFAPMGRVCPRRGKERDMRLVTLLLLSLSLMTVIVRPSHAQDSVSAGWQQADPLIETKEDIGITSETKESENESLPSTPVFTSHGLVEQRPTGNGTVAVYIRNSMDRCGKFRNYKVYEGRRNSRAIYKALKRYGISRSELTAAIAPLKRDHLVLQKVVRDERTRVNGIYQDLNTVVHPQLDDNTKKIADNEKRIIELEKKTIPGMQKSFDGLKNESGRQMVWMWFVLAALAIIAIGYWIRR